MRWLGWILIVAAMATLGTSASAAPPWAALLPFARVEADPNKSYPLEAKHGPWLVLCATFAGETAKRDAQRLVLELRRDFQLEAYVHAQHYDFTQPEQGLGLSKYSTSEKLVPRKMRHYQNVSYDELAVMVGNFPSVEDSSLQQTMQTIKFAQPKALARPKSENEQLSQRFAGLRDLHQRALALAAQATGQAVQQRGPMGMAFATLNPLLPKEEESAAIQLDRVVLDMNEAVEFSLLKCPTKYTVRVATFRGRSTIDQREIAQLAAGGSMESKLEEAALKANRLTTALRRQGIEAYEFHDRNESIVCIGSFDSIGTPGANGRTELDPGVVEIMNRYGAQQYSVTDRSQRQAAGLRPKNHAATGIPFDVQPWPVQVPRPSIGADYATGPAGWFFK